MLQVDLAALQQLSTPHVLEICLDDVGYADLASVPTPNIDALVARSIDFPRSYVTSPVCSPSRVSSLTGRYSSDFGIGGVVNPFDAIGLPNGTETKATVLKSAGYTTCHVGKWHCNPGDPLAPGLAGGFDTWRATALHNVQVALVDGSGNGDYFRWNRTDDGVEVVEESYVTAAQGRAMREWWKETPGRKFGQLWFTAPHGPYSAPPPEFLPPGWPTPETKREKFEAMLIAADYWIGKVLEVVDPDDTFVFLWSDNGTPKGVTPPGQPTNHGKGTMFEGGVNVPFYVHVPGQQLPRESRRLISSVDFLDTYADIARVGADTTDGRSFADELGIPWNTDPPREWVYAVRYNPNLPPYELRQRMVRDDAGWKLTLTEKNGGSKYHLYYLPNETANVANFSKQLELTALLLFQ